MASSYAIRSTPAETFNKITVSCWFKGHADGTQRNFWGLYDNTSSNRFFALYYSTNGSLYGYWKQNEGTFFTLGTTQKFRDPNAWYHFVMTMDTTLSTAADRVKFYVNGERVTSFEDGLDTITQNQTCNLMNGTTDGRMQWGGGKVSGTQYYWNGSMSHCHMCVGYAYDASSFGSTDSTTGIWKINTNPSVSYGTNGGFWFKDGSQLTDSSTNSNTLTSSGTLTNTEDCPSNVFATWNPLAQPNGTLSNGNTSNNGAEDTPATIGITTGKWYWEYKRTNSTSSLHFGICSTKQGFNKTTLQMLNGESNSVGAAIYIYETGTGQTNQANAAGFSSTSYSGVSTPSIANGDIVGCALDISTSSGTLTYYKNGSSMGAATFTYDQETPVFPFIRMNSGASADVNFGNGTFGTTAVTSANADGNGIGAFEYAVPSGYYALCTKNIKEFG